MKFGLLTTGAFALSMAFSTATFAATVGTLTWDGTSDEITDGASTTTYLQFGLTIGKTVAGVENMLAEAKFSDYHIATLTEAKQFFSAAGFTQSTVSVGDYNNANYTDGVFGASGISLSESMMFASDSFWFSVGGNNYGVAEYFTSGGSGLIDSGPYSNLTVDGLQNLVNGSWMLVSNPQVSAVPVPAALFMFAPALVGFIGLRRKLSTARI